MFPYIEIRLKNKINALDDIALQNKVNAAIDAQGGTSKLPVDENGNYLVEIEIDGEKVPVIVGEDGNLSKVTHAINTIDGLKTFLQNKGWDTAKIDAIVNDINNSTDLQDLLNQGKDFTREWNILESYPSFRKTKASIDKIQEIVSKGHISDSDFKTILSVNKGLGNRATDLANFLEDISHFALYKNQNGFDAIISGLKANWFNGAGADGANWVIAVLRKEGASAFAPTKTNFEVVVNVFGNTRRYDAIVNDAVTVGNARVAKYYEFKSYS